MDQKPISSEKKISMNFRAFRKSMRDIWESYNFIDFYLEEIHNQVKNEIIDTFTMSYLLTPKTDKKYSKQDTFGAISHMKRLSNPKRTLLESVSTFENYLTYLVWQVYTDYPHKISTSSSESLAYQQKILKIILETDEKVDMIDKIIEEKIRGLFYGNPIDFFEKDKAHLGFNDYFKCNYQEELLLYTEILAKRNVVIHNGGRIDRKYMREVQNESIKLGSVVEISSEYLREAIILIEGLGAVVTELILTRIYNQKPYRRVYKSHLAFKKYFDNK